MLVCLLYVFCQWQREKWAWERNSVRNYQITQTLDVIFCGQEVGCRIAAARWLD